MENSVPFYQNGMVELIADEEGSLATPTKSAYPGNYISHSGGTGTIDSMHITMENGVS